MGDVVTVEQYLERPCSKCCKCEACLGGPFQFQEWRNGCGECGRTFGKVDLSDYSIVIGSQITLANSVTATIVEVVEMLPSFCYTPRGYVGQIKVEFVANVPACSSRLNPWRVCYTIRTSSSTSVMKFELIANQADGAPTPISYASPNFLDDFDLMNITIPLPSGPCEPITIVTNGTHDAGQLVIYPSCCQECDHVEAFPLCEFGGTAGEFCSACREVPDNILIQLQGITPCQPPLDPDSPSPSVITYALNLPSEVCVRRNGNVVVPDGLTKTVVHPVIGTTINTYDVRIFASYGSGFGGIFISAQVGFTVFYLFVGDACICCRDLLSGASLNVPNQLLCPTNSCNQTYEIPGNINKIIVGSGGSVTVISCCDSGDGQLRTRGVLQ